VKKTVLILIQQMTGSNEAPGKQVQVETAENKSAKGRAATAIDLSDYCYCCILPVDCIYIIAQVTVHLRVT
jgi:shikimate kinase